MSDHADTDYAYVIGAELRSTAAHAALDALLAERKQVEKRLTRESQLHSAARGALQRAEVELERQFTERHELAKALLKCKAERQQAIEALREIAGYGKYLEESGGAKLKLPKAVTIARSALAKLGEQPK